MRLQLLSLLLLPFLAAASSDDQMVLSDAPNEQPGRWEPLMNAGKPSLADLLTIESSASIFYTYARETKLSGLFSDENARSTVLVPTNKAVIALPRKPHQGPAPVDTGVIISEEEFDSQSKRNVERWVSAHIIPIAPISFDAAPLELRTMLEGKNVTLTLSGRAGEGAAWERALLDGAVHLTSMREASNGVMFLLDGTIKFD